MQSKDLRLATERDLENSIGAATAPLDQRLEDLEVSAGFTPGDINDTTTASLIRNQESDTHSELSAAIVSEGGQVFAGKMQIDVMRDFGAKGDGSDDTAAFQAATDFAIAHIDAGGFSADIVCPSPPIAYRISVLNILNTDNARRTLHLSYTAPAGAMIRLFGAEDGSAMINVKARTPGPASGTGWLREVTFNNFVFAAGGDPLAANRRNKMCFNIEQVQALSLNNCWISQFKAGAIKGTDMYDSKFLNLKVLYCGHGTSDTDYAYAINLTGLLDQSNANVFSTIHMEHNPLMIKIDKGGRHNHFTAGGKLEIGTVITDSTSYSPIFIDGGLENNWVDQMFVAGSTLKHMITTNPPTGEYVGLYNVRMRNNFTDCQFAARSAISGRWFSGFSTHFASCVFNMTDGSSASLQAFDLRGDSSVSASTVSMKDLNVNVFRLRGNGNRLKDVDVFAKDGTGVGAVYFLDPTVTNTDIENVKVNGTALSNPLSTTMSYLGINNIKLPRASATLSVGSLEPSVFGRELFTLAPNGPSIEIVNFKHGQHGQSIKLVAGNSNGKIMHNVAKIVTTAGVDIQISNGKVYKFICNNGIWYQE